MTTIVATLESMAADRFVTYGPSYEGGTKIWVAKGSIWGAAGSASVCIAFKKWTLRKGPKPKPESDDDKIDVLQLAPDGLFLWTSCSEADAIKEPFYGIGTGGGYAVGALSMGATLDQAMEVAAKWDANTRAPFDRIALADLKRKRR
jgi:hypothetical protein